MHDFLPKIFSHFVESVKLNFPIGSKLGFVSTIQFVPTLQEAKLQLEQSGFEIALSQNQPLSPGEVLGCTAPVIENVDGIIYLGKESNSPSSQVSICFHSSCENGFV